MRTLKASFLLIGPWEQRLQEIGAHIASDLQQAWHWIHDSSYDVVAISITLVLGKKFPEFFQEITRTSQGTQFIVVVPDDYSPNQLAYLHEEYGFSRVISNFNDPLLENHLFSALEEANQKKQDENLARLMREQTEQLKKLQIELEDRVQKRTRFLTEARRKLYLTNSRIEGFKKALIAVHQASSVAEIEQLLGESMMGMVQTSWIKIFYSPQDEVFAQQVESQLNFTQLQVPLFNQHERIGSIFFLRAPDHAFNKDEGDFLNRVAETVALALNRIQKLKESESLKEQWEATFNSMSDPVVLIDDSFEIIQYNKALNNRLEDLGKDHNSNKCYKMLFNRDTPCPNCSRGKNFRVQAQGQSQRSFEVYSQELQLDAGSPDVYVNLYHDITEQLKMEKQILETAKMAELGTIGSSIAHELNNPLGGILSFTQLILMDMKQEDPLYPDIKEMESGVQRCKEIVQNLLGFTRNPDSDQEGLFSLAEVCARALKILELETKSKGIAVKLSTPSENIMIQGHFNLLAQGLKNILQSCIDRIGEKSRTEKGYRAFLEVRLWLEDNSANILITDNGVPEKNPSLPVGLGLSIASQILRDHHAQLELSLASSAENLAKISFSRPVLRS